MKVLVERSARARRAVRTASLALASALLVVTSIVPTTASAITRTDVLARARAWVSSKVRYSQRSYFHGYRRDCSGFVSMAWRLGRSYTSRTLRSIAKRVPLSDLRPGDAIHTPGHVAIFVRWKDRARGLYVALEQTTWGGTAMEHVRHAGRRAIGLRFHGVTEEVVAAVMPSPQDPDAPLMAVTAVADASTPVVAAAVVDDSVPVTEPSTITVEPVPVAFSTLATAAL